MPDDTIVAIATPPGKGAIAVVRVSGTRTRELAARLVVTKSALRPRYATYATIVDEAGRALDRGLALFFQAPNSYTGEDALELQTHGSPVVVREIVRALLACGARMAQPGEFTRRAFMNGKMDLAAAGAVAELIEAESSSAARAAVANLGGGLANEVRALRLSLSAILEELAGAIDFPEEVPEPGADRLEETIDPAIETLERLRHDGELGRLVREGVSVAIVGPPNAGKSSLLNALLGENRALVSEEAGTTRDTIEESIAIDGVRVRLIDTAGIRSHAGRVEAEGIRRTRLALDAARVAVIVIDASELPAPEALALLDETRGRDRIVFANKLDLGEAGIAYIDEPGLVRGSVRDPESLAALRSAIATLGWGGERPDLERPHLASLREFDAVNEALEALVRARATLHAHEPTDFIAGELQTAFAALGHVSDGVAAEETLDGVFSRFCIGK
jgi:tRNA modification GTPase